MVAGFARKRLDDLRSSYLAGKYEPALLPFHFLDLLSQLGVLDSKIHRHEMLTGGEKETDYDNQN